MYGCVGLFLKHTIGHLYILMPTVAPMVAAVVAGPAARLEVQGPLGGLTDHTPSKPCQLGARGGS